MLEAITEQNAPYSLSCEVLQTAITQEFNNVSDAEYSKLMAVFARYALPYNPKKRRVQRIAFLGAPQHGKTEAVHYMLEQYGEGFTVKKTMWKGQGQYEHPEIGHIRHYDSEPMDYDSTLPSYNDYEYWEDTEKYGVDLAEHGDKDYVDTLFTHIIEIKSEGAASDGTLIRSFKIHTDQEEALSPEYQKCIKEMRALGIG